MVTLATNLRSVRAGAVAMLSKAFLFVIALLATAPCPLAAGQALPDAPAPSQSSQQSPRLVERPSTPAPTQTSADSAPKAPVTVLEDTLIRVMTSEPINSKRVKDGTPLLFTLSEDVTVGDAVVIPRGATVHGLVVQSKKAGVITGSPELTLELTSLDLGGRGYPLYTYQFKVKGTSKTGPTERKALTGAAVGTIAGALVGGVTSKNGTTTEAGAGNPVSMAVGAGVGASVGTVVSAATPSPGVWIPSEEQIDFHLAAPIAVTPVNAKEAARLARGLHPGGPTLYVRDDVQ